MENALIKSLKKGDKFSINNNVYTVKKKFFDWQNHGISYLVTTCGAFFYIEDEIEALDVV